MKSNIALLTCVCVAAFANPAFAKVHDDDRNFDVTLGGYVKMYGNYTNQDDSATGVQNVDILRSSEIHFNAEKEFDSGLTIGVHIEGQADAGDDFATDETYAYVSGKWGQFNFGGKDGAAYLLQVAAPSADRDLDGVRQQITPVNFTAMGVAVGETDYDQNISAKNDKLTYITPLYSGLQFGASYTPELDPSRGGNGNSLDGDDTAPTSDIWDLAIRYQTDLGDDFKLTTGAGYTHASRETGPGADREAWNTGLVLGYKNFSIGASYQEDDEGSSDDEVSYFVVGANYKINKEFTIGASYFNKDDNVGTKIDTDRITGGVSYSYAPGVQFRTSISQYNVDVTNGNEFDATSFVAGTHIDF